MASRFSFGALSAKKGSKALEILPVISASLSWGSLWQLFYASQGLRWRAPACQPKRSRLRSQPDLLLRFAYSDSAGAPDSAQAERILATSEHCGEMVIGQGALRSKTVLWNPDPRP